MTIVADSSGDVKCAVSASGAVCDTSGGVGEPVALAWCVVDDRFRFLVDGGTSDRCWLLEASHDSPRVRQNRHGADGESRIHRIFRRRQMLQAGIL